MDTKTKYWIVAGIALAFIVYMLVRAKAKKDLQEFAAGESADWAATNIPVNPNN